MDKLIVLDVSRCFQLGKLIGHTLINMTLILYLFNLEIQLFLFQLRRVCLRIADFMG